MQSHWRANHDNLLGTPNQIVSLIEEPLLRTPYRSQRCRHHILDIYSDSPDVYAAKPLAKEQQALEYTEATIDSSS